MSGTCVQKQGFPGEEAGNGIAPAAFILPACVRQLGCPLPVTSAAIRSIQAAKSAREREFAQGRVLARRLLAECGSPVLDVPAGSDRAPIWPEGFVGSISHTTDWIGVAVARACDAAAVGIDVETIRPAAEVAHIDSMCLSTQELSLWNCAECPREVFSVLGFSAKEALYKCLYPIVRTFFDFLEAEITAVDFTRGRITSTLLRDLGHGFKRGYVLEGYFVITERHVLTSYFLPPR